MGDDASSENARLKRELQELQQKRQADRDMYEAKIQKEKSLGKQHADALQQKQSEMDAMKTRMVRLNRQLDEEVTRRDQAQAEASTLERKVVELSESGGFAAAAAKGATAGKVGGNGTDQKDKTAAAPTKVMRVVDQWMRHKDMQQALLRGSSINDSSFGTVVQVLSDCPSLQTLDLSQNQLTMDSCSDICQLITTSPALSYISLEGNLLSLRCIGYFMTAIMERQNTKKLVPLDLLDLQGNEGIVAASNAPCPENIMSQVLKGLGNQKMPNRGVELVSQVLRSLWRFLHDTGHPQVQQTSADDVKLQTMDKMTIRKMETALRKILLMSDDQADDLSSANGDIGTGMPAMKAVTADLAFIVCAHQEEDVEEPRADDRDMQQTDSSVHLPPIDKASPSPKKAKDKTMAKASSKPDLRDPFSDLKAAFEPPKEKLKTFNLKQIVTRNGTILMNMLERLLETTEIDARDVETDQTLLEYACTTGNMGLAKLCYRRGANLNGRTKKGNTPFNIVTHTRRYDLMEFLHLYGVKVNSGDADGRTALHVAAHNDDVDAVCRLVEWGADVNIRDNKMRTPLHTAAASGHMTTTMLLLEVGADMNAKDEKEYTAVAHAEANNHFNLMDRLVVLGGKGHGLHQRARGVLESKSAKMIGEVNVSTQMLKSSSLGRIGKVKVSGMPPPLLMTATGKVDPKARSN
eukprot:gnl/TRDRNA2_/TRDRNA2_184607_c0_seq1.p1 gnl/TRDRNA2_/TRDRNA2_184607_c0~~gnl/TRDRNA2_/TRDRNA2_184607_c0_seq1.p1  ORF type:complete len:692 (-),score=179.89 gnl/TRDRNA2_/TRDRNA2_184607_c0_seq1:173-2248(-)